MQADQLRERKGTAFCDHHSRLEIIEDPLSPSNVEVERKVFSSRPTKHSSNSGLTFPHHQAVYIISVMS